MKILALLIILLLSFGLTVNTPAQNPIPSDPAGTPMPVATQATPTAVPRVPFTTEEDLQPPTDGPASNDLGFIGTAKDMPTPVNLETMQATLTVWMTNTPTSPAGLNPQPTATPVPSTPTVGSSKTESVLAAASPTMTASPSAAKTAH